MTGPFIVEEAAAVEEPRLKSLYGYWNGKRGNRLAPMRREIDPVEIPDLLGFLNLYDVQVEPRDYKVRLNGSDVAAMLRQDVTGKSLSEVMEGDDRDRCRKAFSICVDSMKPALFETSLSFCGNDYALQTILALPLSADGERVDMIVSAHAFRLKDDEGIFGSLDGRAVWGE